MPQWSYTFTFRKKADSHGIDSNGDRKTFKILESS